MKGYWTEEGMLDWALINHIYGYSTQLILDLKYKSQAVSFVAIKEHFIPKQKQKSPKASPSHHLTSILSNQNHANGAWIEKKKKKTEIPTA